MDKNLSQSEISLLLTPGRFVYVLLGVIGVGFLAVLIGIYLLIASWKYSFFVSIVVFQVGVIVWYWLYSVIGTPYIAIKGDAIEYIEKKSFFLSEKKLLPLREIGEVKGVTKGLFPQVFGYGTLVLTTPSGDITLRYCDDVDKKSKEIFLYFKKSL